MLRELKMMEMTEKTTMTKSMMFQEMRRYDWRPFIMKPNVTIFKRDSKTKITVITRSIWLRTVLKLPSGSFKGLSIAMRTVLKKMMNMMKGSK